MKCRIQWIDKAGKPTPDENPAIGMVWMAAHVMQLADGRGIKQAESDHFPICVEHAKRLPIQHWVFEPFKAEVKA